MRNVYLLQTGTFNKSKNEFQFHDIDVFSSKKKMEASLHNRMIECNKGYNIEREDVDFGSTKYQMVTYTCLSTENTEMRVRHLLKVKAVY